MLKKLLSCLYAFFVVFSYEVTAEINTFESRWGPNSCLSTLEADCELPFLEDVLCELTRHSSNINSICLSAINSDSPDQEFLIPILFIMKFKSVIPLPAHPEEFSVLEDSVKHDIYEIAICYTESTLCVYDDYGFLTIYRTPVSDAAPTDSEICSRFPEACSSPEISGEG